MLLKLVLSSLLAVADIVTAAPPSPSSNTTQANSTAAPSITSDDNANFTFDELFQLQRRFWDAYMYPANVAQAKAINSSLFAPGMLGRVDLTRTFDGAELNTEYIYGLVASVSLNPNMPSLLGYPTNYSITHFTANKNIAASAVVVTYKYPALDLTLPVEVDTWARYAANGTMIEYDATFRYFGWLMDTLIQAAMPKINATTEAQAIEFFTYGLAQGICASHQTSCTGSNQQYNSTQSCMDFLTKQVRFGKSYELGANTLLCRMVHATMLAYRPQVHCPHIGPTGGAMCVDDRTYAGAVTQPYYTLGPFVPDGYQDANATIAAM